MHDVQLAHEVFAETARGHGRCEILVGGGDDPHVDLRLHHVRAYGLDLAVLEETQEHRLHPQAHLGHFVEEDRAVVRLLQRADLVPEGVGERAFDVAEQLRFEQRLGDTSAVHRDKWLVGTAGVRVNELRDEVLADPALAGDQDLRVPFRHPLRERTDRQKRDASADDQWLAGMTRLLG